MTVSLELAGAVHSVAAIILDCDGVIFDVNAAKTTAFMKALADYPAPAVQRFVDYHRANGGVSRYEKFRVFFEEMNPVECSGKHIARALERYASLVGEAYRRATPEGHALAFLRRFRGACPLYVVSGSDQDELRQVFAKHEILELFDEVLGSPTPKKHHFDSIRARHGVPSTRLVAIGDGRADYEAAKAIGAIFLFLEQYSEWRAARRMLQGVSDIAIAATWTELDEAFACID